MNIKKSSLIAIAIFLFIFAFTAYQADAQVTWKQYKRQEGNTFRDVCYGAGTFVIVGDLGTVWTSYNGTSWAKRTTPTKYNLYAVNYAAGKFVAVGYRGQILTSTNGISWTTRVAYSASGKSLTSVAYNGSLWVAGGIDGMIRTSTNGTSWTTRGSGTTSEFRGMGTNGSMFVGAGSGGKIFHSTNGINWVQHNMGPENLYSVAYGNGTFVVGGASGACFTSPDGITWTRRSTGNTNYLMDTIYTGNVFVACGDSNGYPSSMIITSPDGITWTRRKTPDYSTLLGLASSNNKAVACGTRRLIIGSDLTLGGGSGSITVTAPNGGEKWISGEVYNVTWTSSGVGSKVKVDYSLDGGSSWAELDDSTNNDGTKAWRMPATTSSNCLVKISEVGNPNVSDQSNNTFSIVSSDNVTVTSPNGGEDWEGGSTHNITWDSEGDVGALKIEYSSNNGGSYSTVIASTSNDGSYSWTLPKTVDSTECIVRLSEVSGDANDVSDAPFTITSPPELVLDRSMFNFAYAVGGGVPASQTLGILNGGGGALDWSLVSDAVWLIPSATSGTGSAYLEISVDPTAQVIGDYIATVTVSSSNAVNGDQTFTVNLSVVGASEDDPPIGDFSTPSGGAIVSGSVPVTGWALDDIDLQSVKIYYNEGSYVGDAIFVEGARSDIEAAFPDYPHSSRAGWGYMLLTNALPDGEYTFYAMAMDNAGHSVRLGEAAVTIDNASAILPFGAIDYPPQGGDASGGRYVNWGWGLTPQPNTIPKDGSTIKVWINGTSLGNVYEYGVPNAGVYSLFPDLNNSDGPTGYLHIDTTVYPNGVHIIQWTVQDDAGNVEGIGSRYFNIRNTGAERASGQASIRQESARARDLNPKRGQYRTTAQLAEIPVSMAAATIREGYLSDAKQRPAALPVGLEESISIREGRRVELNLGDGFYNCTGYMVVGEELRPLPVGSSVDAVNGIFYWQPGAGFLGDYRMVFTGTSENGDPLKKFVNINIQQKFNK